MKNSTALKKNVTINFHYWQPCMGCNEQLSMTINDIEICIFGPKCIRIIEEIFNYKFTDGEKIQFIANTFKVDKRDLYINDTYIAELDYQRMWLVNEAFAPITSYSIHINHDNLSWTYSWSQDWHVQNLSGRIEDVDEVQPENLRDVLNQLKEKYSKLVTHNSYYAFEIIEYRGKDYNRLLRWESVGCEPDNFDENIRNKIFKK